jgi:hypothetical protein
MSIGRLESVGRASSHARLDAETGAVLSAMSPSSKLPIAALPLEILLDREAPDPPDLSRGPPHATFCGWTRYR